MSAPRSRSFVPWLLFAVIALIAYGSLYPFNFKPDAIQGGVLQALHRLSWARAGRGDRIANVLLYLPLGFCLFLWLAARLRRDVAFFIATLCGSLLSLSIEVAQVYISSRVPSFTDLALNSLGTLLGAAIGIAWGTIGGWMHLPTRPEKPNRDPSAALLIGLWLTWRLAPFVPHFDLGKLKAALRPLFDPQIEAGAVLIWLTYWLVVSQALSALVSRPHLLEALLLLIAGVLVGRLVVANQAFVPAELLALILLLPIVALLYRMTSRPRRLLLVAAMLIVFFLERLAPFHFAATPANFDFWPFRHWFDAGFSASLQGVDWFAFFGLLFLLGALLWAIRYSGVAFNIAAGLLLALVVATEVLQLWLPDRAGSLTDPGIALGVVLLFRYTQRRQRRALSGRPVSRRGHNL